MTPITQFSREDARFMARAIHLAERGLYSTDPNPRVGCIIVQGNHIVGEGWHHMAGGPHAEIEALRSAGSFARGATAYVSLEPCCHQGKTPPCTEALTQAGITRVVAAMLDPNPKVSGKGLSALDEAGVATACGLLKDAAEALNPGFCKRMQTGRPWLRSKLAMSLDGRTAMQSGDSKWITGADARQDVQRLRARCSAILTGIETVLADDPEMTARLLEKTEEVVQPVRIILDSTLRIPEESKILNGSARTIILTTQAADPAKALALPAEVHVLPTTPSGRVDLAAAVAWLGQAEFNEVLVEAGPTLNGALLGETLVDEWIVYMAPVILGDEGRGLFILPGLNRMTDRIELVLDDHRHVGRDLRLRFLPRDKALRIQKEVC